MEQAKKEKSDKGWYLLRSKAQEQKIIEAFKLFRRRGIEPILIKGWAAARFYPEKSDRVFGDIDLCVEPSRFAEAATFIREEAFNKINIDLHRGFRHLDSLPWENLSENSILVSLEDVQIRVPRPEDHLRILCVHWLTDGGADKEKLWDIYYAVDKRAPDFDWERCLETISRKRRGWIVCAVGLAKKYLGLSLDGTPFENEADEIPGWVTRTVEREWKSDVRLKPLQMCLRDRKMLFRQIRKRIPPNPIQATIELEGSFDRKPRIFYQAANFVCRAIPSIKRIKKVF